MSRVIRRREEDRHRLTTVDEEAAVRQRVAASKRHVNVLAYGAGPNAGKRREDLKAFPMTGGQVVTGLYEEQPRPAQPGLMQRAWSTLRRNWWWL